MDGRDFLSREQLSLCRKTGDDKLHTLNPCYFVQQSNHHNKYTRLLKDVLNNGEFSDKKVALLVLGFSLMSSLVRRNGYLSIMLIVR